jgi:hypothetical protein
MQLEMQFAPISKKMLWTGRVISTLPVLLLIFSAAMKLAHPTSVVEGFAKFGYPAYELPILGIVEIACTLIYLIPKTSILGAILLTGYLGGATATHARLSDPSFIMPVICGILIWQGLLLRDRKLQALLPLRK